MDILERVAKEEGGVIRVIRQIRKRWDNGMGLQDLLTGAGLKPPEAAWINSPGSEGVWLIGLVYRGQVWCQRMSYRFILQGLEYLVHGNEGFLRLKERHVFKKANKVRAEIVRKTFVVMYYMFKNDEPYRFIDARI
jgi:hypothetical protein